MTADKIDRLIAYLARAAKARYIEQRQRFITEIYDLQNEQKEFEEAHPGREHKFLNAIAYAQGRLKEVEEDYNLAVEYLASVDVFERGERRLREIRID